MEATIIIDGFTAFFNGSTWKCENSVLEKILNKNIPAFSSTDIEFGRVASEHVVRLFGGKIVSVTNYEEYNEDVIY